MKENKNADFDRRNLESKSIIIDQGYFSFLIDFSNLN